MKLDLSSMETKKESLLQVILERIQMNQVTENRNEEQQARKK